ncbi:hypothetical protein F5X99DRAFT_411151 [Biscogniauxia marginata]|nr:hypothetical protein F5X99DRAFT_411151 [Biscogniauxia marginata]
MATNVEATPQFSNTFGAAASPTTERKSSRDYSNTDEWDASKTPPSRFQKRKGSIYATPSSRDGHVERNRDAVEEFHKAHSKRWSVGGSGSGSRRGSAAPDAEAMAQKQRKSSKDAAAAAAAHHQS